MEDYNVIRVLCSTKKIIFLPYYISGKLFFIEIAWKYKFWFHTLSEKRKNKFIPLPRKVGEILLQGISKIDEYVAYLENYDLKFTEKIKGFNPNHIFL
jgi:hypothetical protein